MALTQRTEQRLSDVNVNCVTMSVSVHGNLLPRSLFKLWAVKGMFDQEKDLLSFCETIPNMSLATVLLIPIRPTRKLPWDLSSPICIALSFKQIKKFSPAQGNFQENLQEQTSKGWGIPD